MGWGTERIFLPLLQTTAPDLIDYHMPENGVFHNLILASIKPRFKGHARQIMHAFWGVGQMSFVKHALFVDESLSVARELTIDGQSRKMPAGTKLTKEILENLTIEQIKSLEVVKSDKSVLLSKIKRRMYFQLLLI